MICPNCQAQIPGKPVTCPNCKQKMRSLSLNNSQAATPHLQGQAVRQQPIQQSYAQPPPMINNPYMQQQMPPPQMNYGQAYVDPVKAKRAMTLAYVSLGAWLIALAGIIVSIVGLIYGIQAKKTPAIVICIITLILSIINMIAGFAMYS